MGSTTPDSINRTQTRFLSVAGCSFPCISAKNCTQRATGDTSLLSGHHFVFSHFHRFCTFLRCSGKTRFLRLNLALLSASHP